MAKATFQWLQEWYSLHIFACVFVKFDCKGELFVALFLTSSFRIPVLANSISCYWLLFVG